MALKAVTSYTGQVSKQTLSLFLFQNLIFSTGNLMWKTIVRFIATIPGSYAITFDRSPVGLGTVYP